MQLTITNLTTEPVHLGDFYTSVPVLTPLVVTRAYGQASALPTLSAAVALGSVEVTVQLTAEEAAAGLSPPFGTVFQTLTDGINLPLTGVNLLELNAAKVLLNFPTTERGRLSGLSCWAPAEAAADETMQIRFYRYRGDATHSRSWTPLTSSFLFTDAIPAQEATDFSANILAKDLIVTDRIVLRLDYVAGATPALPHFEVDWTVRPLPGPTVEAPPVTPPFWPPV